MKIKIISGGQTGVDRAALDAAIALHIPYGGMIPKGRLAEDGKIPPQYILTEAPIADYEYRTEQNVLASDATLILGYVPLSGGTAFTEACCQNHSKTYVFFDLNDPQVERKIIEWIKKIQPKILNIAGPRESKHPGIYQTTKKLLESAFSLL